MTASFEEFLRTGVLGSIATGMTKDSVREISGDPGATSISKNPDIWKYGPIELSFYRAADGRESSLTSIIYYFGRPDTAPTLNLTMTGWLPTGETTFEEFRSYLDRGRIPVDGGVASGPRQHLVLGSSSRVTFEEGKLSSVGFTARREPDLKQLSISIPKDNFESIRREAKSRGISVAALCSLWIGEHASSLRSH